jgi:hypothetical protein
LLDGIQVGAVGGEIKRNCAARLDCFFDSVDFVDADVVHEHDVALLQRRSETLFGIGLEHLAGHRSFEHEGRGDAIMAQGGDESDGLPVAVGHFLDQPFALRCSPVEAGNRRRNAGFIDEDKAASDRALAAVFADPYVRRRRPAGPARRPVDFFLKRNFK